MGPARAQDLPCGPFPQRQRQWRHALASGAASDPGLGGFHVLGIRLLLGPLLDRHQQEGELRAGGQLELLPGGAALPSVLTGPARGLFTDLVAYALGGEAGLGGAGELVARGSDLASLGGVGLTLLHEAG